jgi:uncharacterized protein (DUF433 family)
MDAAMATVAKLTDYPHIEKNPGVRGGKACIAGTRIAVVDAALAHQEGLSPEEIRTCFSSRPLTLAEVYSALAYHHDHPHELDEYVQGSDEAAAEVEKIKAEYLRRHPGR